MALSKHQVMKALESYKTADGQDLHHILEQAGYQSAKVMDKMADHLTEQLNEANPG